MKRYLDSGENEGLVMSEGKRGNTITDLVLTVTRVIPIQEGEDVGNASGFFYLNKNRLYLVTNRHVVINEGKDFKPEALKIRVHVDPSNTSQNADVVIPLYDDSIRLWREDCKANADIAVIELSRAKMKGYIIKAFSRENTLPKDVMINLGDPVRVLGYPLGFHDEFHNLPIIRNAILASVYPVPFRGNPYFLIDARLHRGMCGSPVVTKPSIMVSTQTETSLVREPITHFLGILSHTFPVPKEAEPLDLSAVWFASLIEAITS